MKRIELDPAWGLRNVQAKILALKYQYISEVTLRAAFRWVKVNFKLYEDYLLRVDHYRKPRLKPQQAAREYKFMGFVTLEEYHIRPNFSHLISQSINGVRYIYPEHFAHDIYKRDRGYRYDYHNLIGVEGCGGVTIPKKQIYRSPRSYRK